MIETSTPVVTGAETGFWISHNPDTVRAPDAAFVCFARVPAEATPDFFDGAPDLAVEVLSPNDRAGEVLAKVQQWLAAGVSQANADRWSGVLEARQAQIPGIVATLRQ